MLSNNVILVISPQEWGKMFVAKHHYALELAKRNNKVFFLNPPLQDGLYQVGKGFIDIVPSGAHDNLYLINHRLNFPYILKFKGKGLFLFLMRFHVKNILRLINGQAGAMPGVVWVFDQGNMYPFRYFKKAHKIFHPVDEPLNQQAVLSAKGADIIFSVTEEILKKYEHYPVPRLFLHHGISDYFFSGETEERPIGDAIRVGVSGNLVRPDIDTEIFLRIIRENPAVIFECWGSYNLSQSNLGGGDSEQIRAFIEELKSCPNVVLHGPVSSRQLATAMRRMDAFLICYDVNRDQSKGTNYHKIMEYLSTGKVIISNNVSTYTNAPNLVQMVRERNNNAKLPALFKHIIERLAEYNSPELQQERIAFAKSNLYSNNVQTIEEKLHAHVVR